MFDTKEFVILLYEIQILLQPSFKFDIAPIYVTVHMYSLPSEVQHHTNANAERRGLHKVVKFNLFKTAPFL